ncbi:MAG: DNA polymerase/3'-5' exonuclease PolX [Candidatus Binatia bacterium]
MKDRFEIAAELRVIARLLTIKGENQFKVQAYERGARTLETFQGDFDKLVKAGRLKEIAGVGNALSAIIEETYRTGESWVLGQLRQELPAGTVELSEVPGLSLKKIIALNEALHIETVTDLKSACEQGLVSKIKGFGLKSQQKLRTDIEQLETRRQDRSVLLSHAIEQAEGVLGYLRLCPALLQAELVGDLRRQNETVEEILIVAATDQPKLVIDHFLRLPTLARTIDLTDERCIGFLAAGTKARVEAVAPDEFVATLHARTGAPNHIVKLQNIARSKGLDLTFGKARSTGGTRCKSEDEIYQRLGLQYIPPELREDQGEIEAAMSRKLSQPLVLEDIRGMTHCHTIYSDGRNTIEEMALAAEAMGMKYLTITDHSPSAYYARGVSIDRLHAQWDEIARVQERVKIKLLRGTESDILEDGSLDYPDHYLAQFDIVIASIHSRHKMDADQMTHRLLRALKLPVFKIWGHPLGRLIQSRSPFACRMEEVLDAVAVSRCAIEVNGDPHRLDLAPEWIRAARLRGIKFIVSTDAHSAGALNYLTYGVSTARRGWLTQEEVLNTLDSESFMQAVRP